MPSPAASTLPGPPSSGEITLLLQRPAAGDAAANDQLLSLVYQQLHTLAAAKMSR